MAQVKVVTSESRVERMREMMSQREKNIDSIRCIQAHNFTLEQKLVEELAQAGDYYPLQVNWSRLKYVVK